MLSRLLAVALVLGLVGCKDKVFDASAPGQKGHNNPTHEMGADSFEQRQKDCWDMPNAAACYEVGLNYELGISVTQDRKEALSYYEKACDISDDPDHCEAADKMRAKLAP